MTLRINNNIAAMNSRLSALKNDGAAADALEKLSSGLRINKAADDAAGMYIADSLRSQALGLGQAIRNANDAISLVQVADGALEESIAIIHTVKTKAIQAAQDGQTTESRAALQADIDKLLAELDTIAKTTSFNNQKLLSGSFTNKRIQVGSSPWETVNVTIPSTEVTNLGHRVQGWLSVPADDPGVVEISLYSRDQDHDIRLAPVTVAYDNERKHSLAALADNINRLGDVLGVQAEAVVRAGTTGPVRAGYTDADFAINGVMVGGVAVKENDADGALVQAINRGTSEHGVTASVGNGGRLTLASTDGRAIQVTSAVGSGSGTDAVLQGADLTTFGYVQINQTGSQDIVIHNAGGGEVVALTNDLETADSTVTVEDSFLAAGSRLAGGSRLAAGWLAGQELHGDLFAANIGVEEPTSLAVGSVLGPGSRVVSAEAVPGSAVVEATGSTYDQSTIGAGSILASGSVLGPGTVLSAGRVIPAGTVFRGDGSIAATAPTSGDSTVTASSVLAPGTVIASGSDITGLARIMPVGPTNGQATVTNGSLLRNGSRLGPGTVLTEPVFGSTAGLTTGNSTVTTNSQLATNSVLGAGSTIGSGTVLTANTTIDTISPTAGNTTVTTGSLLTDGSVLAANTSIPAGQSFDILPSGTTLSGPLLVGPGNATLNGDQPVTAGGGLVLLAGSDLLNGSVLNAGSHTDANSVVLAGPVTLGGIMTMQGGDATFTAGSRIFPGSFLRSGSHVDSDALTLNGDYSVTIPPTLQSGSQLAFDSRLAPGSRLDQDQVTLAAGMTLATDMTLHAGSVFAANTFVKYGSSLAADATLITGLTLQEQMVLGSDMDVSSEMLLAAGSSFGDGSLLARGSLVSLPSYTVKQDLAIQVDFVLRDGSLMAANGSTRILAGTTVGGEAILRDDLLLARDMELAAGSVVGRGSALRNGSTLGGPVTLAEDEVVSPDSDLEVKRGSLLAAGSIIGRGTYLTNGITGADGVNYPANTLLTVDVEVGAPFVLEADMSLAGGTRLSAGSVLAANRGTDAAVSSFRRRDTHRLSNVNVLSQEGAQVCMGVADAALQDLEKSRSELGSVQNQLGSTIANISTTRVNVTSSESTIRDVDFAEESAIFTKMQILARAGAFALNQANKTSQRLLDLLA